VNFPQVNLDSITKCIFKTKKSKAGDKLIMSTRNDFMMPVSNMKSLAYNMCLSPTLDSSKEVTTLSQI